MVDSIQKKTKRDTIPRLVKLDLTPEQITEALDLSLNLALPVVINENGSLLITLAEVFAYHAF